MEEVRKAFAYQITYKCDECGIGQMEPTGFIKMSNPPLFQHKCDLCGHIKDLENKYPEIRVTGKPMEVTHTDNEQKEDK